jgi:hypothetical protein
MSSRKTVNVEQVRTWANNFLAAPDAFSNLHTPEERKAQRQGVAALLDTVLQATGNYHGFMYQPSEWDEAAGRLRDGYDDSRRRYL